MPTCQTCGSRFPNRVTIEGVRRNLCNRKFCLLCSPFGKHNTREDFDEEVQRRRSLRLCVVCGRKNAGGRRLRCNSCNTKIRRFRAKLSAVAFLGGKCNRCGWNKHVSGLEFHHVSGVKEFGIGNVANRSWNVVKEELRKCELLCATCHRLVHHSRDDERLLEEVQKYQGRSLDW
jgi:phage FluMu protein Com